LKSFFEMIYMIGTCEVQIVYLILSFNLMGKPAALYFWCAVGFINFITNQLQAAYAQERPYCKYEDIHSE